MNYNNDLEYQSIVNDILNNDDFKKLSKITHHGTTRDIHCLRVSYMAYKKAKKNGLDYVSAARGGLLHDFFFTNKYDTREERKEMFLKHPSIALDNATKDFKLNDIEKDAILNHMYPATKEKPKYDESVLVSLCDKKVAVKELTRSKKYRMQCASNVFLILLFNALS